MLMRASEVRTMTSRSLSKRRGSSGLGIPAMTDPTVVRTIPASTALAAPERLKPKNQFQFGDGRNQIAFMQSRALYHQYR